MQTYSRVYDSYPQAQQVVSELEAAGVPSADISLIANRYVDDSYDADAASAAASGVGIGAALGGGAGLLAGLGVVALPGLGPVIAAGWLASTAVGAVAGSAAGGVLGALVDAGTPEREAHVYSEAVRRGGTLVTVRTANDRAPVEQILNRHNPIDPNARHQVYTDTGWEQFDPNAPAYRPDKEEIERMRRRYE